MRKNVILLIILICVAYMFIPQPKVRAKTRWYIGKDGDFPSVMEAVNSNLVQDGDELYLISDVYDEFYGRYLDKSLTIIGNGYNWKVNRYALPKQLQIIDSTIHIYNISIEFFGVYTEHLFSLEGADSELYLENVLINISRGGGVDNIATDIFTAANNGNYNITLRDVTLTTVNFIKIKHISKATIINTDISITIDNLSITPIEDMIKIEGASSNISITMNNMGSITGEPLINVTLVDAKLNIHMSNLEYKNSYLNGIAINSTGDDEISIFLTRMNITDNQKKFISLVYSNRTKINLYLNNLRVENSGLINSQLGFNHTETDIDLRDIYFKNSQPELGISLYSSKANLSFNNLHWIGVSPRLHINGEYSNLTLTVYNLTVADSQYKVLSISTTNSTVEGTIHGIKLMGILDKVFEMSLTNSTVNLNISDIKANRIIQIGFTINARNTEGTINISSVSIEETNRRMGYINMVDSKIKVTLMDISFGRSSQDGLLLSGDTDSQVTLKNSDLSNCSGWSLYIQGGKVDVNNSKMSRIYVTTASMNLTQTKFDEVNSLIFFSNITVDYLLKGNLISNLSNRPLSGVSVTVLDSQGNIIGSTYTDTKGLYFINLHYQINETYRAHPLTIKYNTTHYNWTIQTGNYTMEEVRSTRGVIYHALKLYLYKLDESAVVAKLVVDSDLNTAYLSIGGESYSGFIKMIDPKLIYLYFNTRKGAIAMLIWLDTGQGVAFYTQPYPPLLVRISR